jgi:site-specific DNA-methyltransferase (adenine-specific)
MYHRMVRAMRRVGFIDVHLVGWGYGSGFPKSLNISKALDRQAKAERKIIGYKRGVGGENMNDLVRGVAVRQTTDAGGKGVGAYGTGAKQVAVDVPITAPATELAILWDGYGTALKPAWEPIVVGRKP